jgi:pSer/pThr/pTyr-binding forkhead associated (FHA) protein
MRAQGADRDRGRGLPFLAYRDGDERQRIFELGERGQSVAVGRGSATDSLECDEEVSWVHAELERIGDAWTVIDDGLSRNGTDLRGDDYLIATTIESGPTSGWT